MFGGETDATNTAFFGNNKYFYSGVTCVGLIFFGLYKNTNLNHL